MGGGEAEGGEAGGEGGIGNESRGLPPCPHSS